MHLFIPQTKCILVYHCYVCTYAEICQKLVSRLARTFSVSYGERDSAAFQILKSYFFAVHSNLQFCTPPSAYLVLLYNSY